VLYTVLIVTCIVTLIHYNIGFNYMWANR